MYKLNSNIQFAKRNTTISPIKLPLSKWTKREMSQALMILYARHCEFLCICISKHALCDNNNYISNIIKQNRLLTTI